MTVVTHQPVALKPPHDTTDKNPPADAAAPRDRGANNAQKKETKTKLTLRFHTEPAVEAEKQDSLIRQLGSSSYAEREAARRELRTVLPQVSTRLQDAIRSSDQEVRARAASLLLETPVEFSGSGDASKVLKKLSIMTGIPISISVEADPHVEVKAGGVPLKEVLQQICKQADYGCSAAAGRVQVIHRNPSPEQLFKILPPGGQGLNGGAPPFKLPPLPKKGPRRKQERKPQNEN